MCWYHDTHCCNPDCKKLVDQQVDDCQTPGCAAKFTDPVCGLTRCEMCKWFDQAPPYHEQSTSPAAKEPAKERVKEEHVKEEHVKQEPAEK
ncbi:hypothetical protein IFR05_008123 [Cadophora sp. M221]|nr:hypothetical protein IFR05_008123 [Cadophora sp. M221]